MSSLNKARISSASLNVKRLSAAVIAIARLVFATMAADSGVLLQIILVLSSFDIRYFPRPTVERAFRRTRAAPRFAKYSHKAEGPESTQTPSLLIVGAR